MNGVEGLSEGPSCLHRVRWSPVRVRGRSGRKAYRSERIESGLEPLAEVRYE
jgi:hypothetical protein